VVTPVPALDDGVMAAPLVPFSKLCFMNAMRSWPPS
jgi:hypothetical protein